MSSELAADLGCSIGTRVTAYVFELELTPFEGPIGPWREHFGKGKNQVRSPQGESSCAEAEIVRLLRARGWNAAWLEDWASTSIPANWKWAVMEERELPSGIRLRHDRIRERSREVTGQRAGCWDVIAWKDEVLWYLEAKGPGDGLNKNQVAWWIAACELEPTIQFALVEWRPRRL
jgi:hypothetical protein